mgnify:CR=1 FL=1
MEQDIVNAGTENFNLPHDVVQLPSGGIFYKSKKNDAVIPYIRNTDTVVFKNQILDRKKVLSIQTPQCFSYRKIFSLHKEYKNKKFNDESSLFFLKS